MRRIARARPHAVILYTSIMALGLPACADSEAPADRVLINAVVYTMNAAQPTAEAVAIRAGEIVYVGDRDGADAFIDEATIVDDLEGAVVLPGFHDSHTHLIWSGAELEDVDLYDATTVDEL